MDDTEHMIEDPTTREEMERKLDALRYLAESRKTDDPSERAMWYAEAMSTDAQEVRDAQRVMGTASLFRKLKERAEETISTHEQKIEAQEDIIDDLKAENMELRVIANVDKLTSLFNRLRYDRDVIRYVWEMERVKRAREARSPISALMIDIDNFGPINDYGHEIGDRGLEIIGKIIRSETGDSGRAYRYGGEELVVLLPDTRKDEACELAERIRQAVESQKFEFSTNGKVKTEPLTVSVGVGSIGELDYPRAMNWIYADKGFVDGFFGSISDERKAEYSGIMERMGEFFSDGRYMGKATGEDVFRDYGKSLREFDPIFREQFHIEFMAYTLLKRADLAEAQSKASGKNRVHVYDPEEDRPVLYSFGAKVKPRYKKDTIRLIREMGGNGNQNP